MLISGVYERSPLVGVVIFSFTHTPRHIHKQHFCWILLFARDLCIPPVIYVMHTYRDEPFSNDQRTRAHFTLWIFKLPWSWLPCLRLSAWIPRIWIWFSRWYITIGIYWHLFIVCPDLIEKQRRKSIWSCELSLFRSKTKRKKNKKNRQMIKRIFDVIPCSYNKRGRDLWTPKGLDSPIRCVPRSFVIPAQTLLPN